MRDYRGALEWYRTHQTTGQIGFNPDGMCLKVCRTARAIGSMYASAKQAQDAVPAKYRTYRVRDLRRGMVLFFDDPHDSNKAGHIVTMIGRVPGFDPESLHDVLVETNSVVSGQVVVVRGDYFIQHWGDPFQFGATWLNGEVLDVPSGNTRVAAFHKGGPEYDVKLLDEAIKHGRSELKPLVARIQEAVDYLPNDKGNTRVAQFKRDFYRTRVLRMGLLSLAVNDGERFGKVKSSQLKLRHIIHEEVPTR